MTIFAQPLSIKFFFKILSILFYIKMSQGILTTFKYYAFIKPFLMSSIFWSKSELHDKAISWNLQLLIYFFSNTIILFIKINSSYASLYPLFYSLHNIKYVISRSDRIHVNKILLYIHMHTNTLLTVTTCWMLIKVYIYSRPII